MNFVKNLHNIQNKLFKRNRFSGCYIYSRDIDDNVFKIGMSEKNLFGRVKNAKSCYPFKSEFYIHLLIITHDISNVRPLEKELHKESKELKKVDIEKGAEQGERPREWRVASSRASLNKAVMNVLKQNRALWSEVVVFGSNGWVIYRHKLPRSLNPTKTISQQGIERGIPVKLGDMVYVVYKENEHDKPRISKQGKIVEKMKHKFKVHWNDYKGKPFTGAYSFNEVYKLKSEALYAKRYWYE